MSEIEQISPITTRRLRQEVLYPNQPIDSVILDEDDQGIHFGFYEDNTLIAVICGATQEPQRFLFTKNKVSSKWVSLYQKKNRVYKNGKKPK